MKEDAKPYYAKPYNVPVSQLPLLKTFIYKMVDKRVLEETTEDIEWATTFCVKEYKQPVTLECPTELSREAHGPCQRCVNS